jgi:hypothetical protein
MRCKVRKERESGVGEVYILRRSGSSSHLANGCLAESSTHVREVEVKVKEWNRTRRHLFALTTS